MARALRCGVVMVVGVAACGDGLHRAPDAVVERRTCSGFLGFCAEVEPTAPLAITSPTTVDTDGALCEVAPSYGSRYCVLVGTDIAIDAPLRATGSRPLVLLAKRSIVTTALIDVGSHSHNVVEVPPSDIGAGANPGVCDPGTHSTTLAGWAGGSFMGRGGDGAHGMAGAPVAYASELRGGCPAQGRTEDGGQGGGAVFLSAGDWIEIGGGINAAGAGVRWRRFGGMIGLEAPQILSTSLLLAGCGGPRTRGRPPLSGRPCRVVVGSSRQSGRGDG